MLLFIGWMVLVALFGDVVSAALSIKAGSFHTCVIVNNGGLKCFGRNNFGQLGLGHTITMGDNANEMGSNLPEVNLGTNLTAKSIALGTYHTCVLLRENDQVKCFGDNSWGQLGKGNTVALGDGANEMGDNLTVIQLGTNKTAKEIGAGDRFTCVAFTDGTMKCFGNNE